MTSQQTSMIFVKDVKAVKPFSTQLLKWIGNKQRFAHEIIGYFPKDYSTYYEPFIGSGAVLGTLAPKNAIASDILKPLVEIWDAVAKNPEMVKKWYEERYEVYYSNPDDKKEGYEKIKASYNKSANGADLLFLSRSCYGGVIRFRKNDGYMSTPCGVHSPVSVESFGKRVDIWHERVKGTKFIHSDFEAIMDMAKPGDLVYCDPPYADCQAIVYGAQSFDLQRLYKTIDRCKKRGVKVVLSLDGTKKTGKKVTDIKMPDGLFESIVSVNCGRSMLRRFQMNGQTLEEEVVTDRLLLTY